MLVEALTPQLMVEIHLATRVENIVLDVHMPDTLRMLPNTSLL